MSAECRPRSPDDGGYQTTLMDVGGRLSLGDTLVRRCPAPSGCARSRVVPERRADRTESRSAMAAKLPDVIERYQEAQDSHDVDGALAAFAADATGRDEGQQWLGTTEIRNWLNKTSTEYTFTRTLLNVQTTGDGSW